MNEIVLDLETQFAFSEVPRGDPSLLKISLVGVYRYDTDSYVAYREADLKQLWPVLEAADRVIGFNINHFDYAVLRPYYPGRWQEFPTLDIFTVAEQKLGFRVGLDAIAQASLGHGKTGHGLDALKWYREGNWKDLERYCLDDVRVTKEVYEYGKKHGELKYQNRMGSGQFSVDFSFEPKPRSVNLTLGI